MDNPNHDLDKSEDSTPDLQDDSEKNGGEISSSSDCLTALEESLSTSNKRVQSGSPGSTKYSMCRVDNCREDLSKANDFHRRHKVCETHSKSTKALVEKDMQRFCQQCTKFHPLSEFDGKLRSCRQKLDVHNRRRRKKQPDDVLLATLAESTPEATFDDGPPSYSPVLQLFPMQTSKETVKPKRTCIEVNAGAEASRNPGCITSLELFGGSTRGADTGSFQSSPHQAGHSSSSWSDHLPSSLSSDAQDRTGRILFKLFDKDPSQIPGDLRKQILNWLSDSPSEMESYIRPGCVVLSIYVSLAADFWEQLEENLLLRANSLVQDIDSDFWRNGRFLVSTGRELASRINGKIRLCKSWRTWKAPELIVVTPIAVVAGEETCFILRGRYLTNPGTKIHCTYMGGYISKEVAGSTTHGTTYDEITFGSLKFDGASSSALGRCFIEVENGFKCNSFPVIIAYAPICLELRLLESELDEETKMLDVMSEDHNPHNGSPRSREEVLHFLNELGWLFQRRKRMSCMLNIPDYSLARFKYLLAFSVERDYCALVKELLDILVEGNMDRDFLSLQSMEMLSEVQLLNRAVKRRCRKMVDLLINYSLISRTDDSKRYIFPPNILGPGRVTPLHLAACTSGLDDTVDCLMNDPQMTIRRASSQTPIRRESPQTMLSQFWLHSCNRYGNNAQESRMLNSETSEMIYGF